MKLNIEKLQSELTRIDRTQAWLAKQMKVRPQWVYQIFNNDISHTMRTIQKIADALNLDPKDLIK